MSKAEEAREDAEVIDAPPPTYEASVAGESELYSEHDYHIIEAGPSNPDEKRAIDTFPTAMDEKNPIEPTPEFYTPIEKSQAMIPYQKEEDYETPPALPIRPPSLASTSTPFHPIPLTYTLSWRRPLFERRPYFDCPALTISPQNNQILPPQTPGMPSTSHWQLNYEKKYFARLHRYAPEQAAGEIPYRQVAEIQYPDFMWPNGGVKIKFEPHEEEIARRGSRHVSRTDKMMVRTGWWSAKYGIDLPVLNGARVNWVNANETVVERGPKLTRAQKLGLKPGEVHLVTLGEVWDECKVKSSSLFSPSDSSSTFPIQHLIEETSGRILARFTRARPLAKEVGKLEILPGEQGVSPEYIEGIVVATAAMVGMKDRMGVMSSLIEAGTSGGKRREEEATMMQMPREKEVKFDV